MKALSGWITLTLLSCSLVPAQQPSSTHTAPTITELVAARVARLTKLLTLTSAQAAAATSTFTIEETTVSAIRTNLATVKTALTTAIETNNGSGIASAATQTGTLTAQRVQAEASAEATFYLSLTATQRTIYQELLASGLHGNPPGDHGPRGGGPHK
ncbi:hypothetical protein [Bryobacter aggregatus]|uniref:hypothetical protein n=1 Tax=Bryobacter aggregatus TaxID=360054 RepID=UPI0004E12A55|nr:hypothetical protein [Bryobacter aggregatus]